MLTIALNGAHDRHFRQVLHESPGKWSYGKEYLAKTGISAGQSRGINRALRLNVQSIA